MTGVPETAPVKPIDELFTPTVSALWATTYGVDLELFNEFLLGRLGDPPLNVAVLADHRRLTASLARVPAERVATLTAVNRRWLLRGVDLGGQAFHPKTYLAVTARRATLLVGSGNLATAGLDEGCEVFTVFRSGTPAGDAAITSWRAWMRRIVELVADVRLAERFRVLEEQLPARPPDAATGASPLLDNLDTPIATQLAAAVSREAPGGVDELLLAAPFYDEDAGAVGRLLTDLAPRRVRLFVTESMSVNGDRLAERLAGSQADVEVVAYEPDAFVHAKLIGVIAGGRGWVLSGSPNLSGAALTRVVGAGGNAEVAVLAELGGPAVREVFVPPGMRTATRDLHSLVSLRFQPEPERAPPPVRLVTAILLRGRRVEVVSDPPVEPGWLLDDLTGRQPLSVEVSGRAVTAGPLTERLVQLVDADGAAVSNRVVVDDPDALTAALTARPPETDIDRPYELAEGDLDTPTGRMVMFLHRNLINDVSDSLRGAQVGGGATGEAAAGEAGGQADDELWERLEREQLARDPRVDTYKRLWSGDAGAIAEPIIGLLEAVGAPIPSGLAAGGADSSLLAHLLTRAADNGADDPDDNAGDDGGDDGPPVRRRWSRSARIRVRLRNVLHRWAAAQSDPRLMWIDRFAPTGNFAVITLALATLRWERSRDPASVELTGDDLDDVWLHWLRSFAGTGTGDGWLDRFDQDDGDLADRRLPTWLGEWAAALCWLAVRPDTPGYRDRIIACQPALTAALAHGLIDPTEATASHLSVVTGRTISRSQVDRQLLEAVEFTDDDLWCERTRADLGLAGLAFNTPPGAAGIQVRLDVQGVEDPLLDPRVPRLAAAVRHYRGCTGIALYAADTDWRLVLVTGEPIGYRPNKSGGYRESTGNLTDGLLEQLAASTRVLADLFPPE